MDTTDKKTILEKISTMSVDELDLLRDKKIIELRDSSHELYLAKDEELTIRHNKLAELLKENSHSKAEQILRSDEELFNLKKKILGLRDVKNKLELEIEIIKSAFWKART